MICGLGGNDSLNGRGGSDELYGGGGNDVMIGVSGVDALDGGAGNNDSANYPRANQAVEVDLSTGVVADDGRGFAETVANVERVTGATNQANTITGDDANNRLVGGLLADDLTGGDGADVLRGEAALAATGADDTLAGGDGADALFPGLGTNTIDGGAGSDALRYGLVTAAGVDIIAVDGVGNTSGAVTDNFTAVESMTGTANDDDIAVAWNGVVSVLRGAGGDDVLATIDGDTLDTMGGGAGVNSCANPDPDTAINC